METYDNIIVLNLCEVPHLILKPNVLYRFEVAEGCEKCKEASDASKIEE